MKKILYKLCLSYVVLLCLFMGLSVIAYEIPERFTIENVHDSLQRLDEEGVYPANFGIPLLRKDNFTDALMYAMSISGDEESTSLDTAMLNPVLYSTDTLLTKAQIGLEIVAGNKDFSKGHYGRYWHGYMFPLRVASIWLSIDGLRILNYILLTGLALVCIYMLYMRLGRNISLAYIVSLLGVGFWLVPASLQFSSCFYIMFAAILVIMFNAKLVKSVENSCVFFFIIGALTSFFDLLTTPIITLGIPLAVILMCDKEHDQRLRMLFMPSLGWALGYFGLWASKWLLATVITNSDILVDAIESASFRSSAVSLTDGDDRLYTIVGMVFWLPAVIYVFAWTFAFIRFTNIVRSNLRLFIVGLLPFVWFVMLQNHSVVHFWFTWRDLIVSIFCGLVMTAVIYEEKWKGKNVRL